jgi:hypothetical protein
MVLRFTFRPAKWSNCQSVLQSWHGGITCASGCMQTLQAAHPSLVRSNAVLVATGETPLGAAAGANATEALLALLDMQADVEALDGNGCTALQVHQQIVGDAIRFVSLEGTI